MLRLPSHTRLAATIAAAALAATVAAAPAGAAGGGPDTDCQRAGMNTLRSAGLLDDVARVGLPIETVLSLGVTVRDGADISGLDDPLKLSVILADHRAGDQSLSIYPWCNRAVQHVREPLTPKGRRLFRCAAGCCSMSIRGSVVSGSSG